MNENTKSYTTDSVCFPNSHSCISRRNFISVLLLYLLGGVGLYIVFYIFWPLLFKYSHDAFDWAYLHNLDTEGDHADIMQLSSLSVAWYVVCLYLYIVPRLIVRRMRTLHRSVWWVLLWFPLGAFFFIPYILFMDTDIIAEDTDGTRLKPTQV